MRVLLALASLLFGSPASAQHMGHALYGPYPMSREASGTAWQPDAAAHEGRHVMLGGWMGMAHGYAKGVYTRQGGDRGGAQVFSTSMFMANLSRDIGPGRLGLRGMVSLDPAMGPRGYKLLLQTGETADGKTPLVDRQHPHELIDELAATYSVSADDASVFVYAGLPGEPALGPVVFMHRFSGLENPEAPLSHHWLDSTHVTMGVATLGGTWRGAKLEGSLFRGREPNEYRWDIEKPKLDSHSARLSLNPAPEWSLQASYGRLHQPEQLAPGADVERITASTTYHRERRAGALQATAAFGRNQHHGEKSDAALLEGSLRWDAANTAFFRAERVENGELYTAGPNAGKTFVIGKLSAGVLRELGSSLGFSAAVGGLVSAYSLPGAVRADYGDFPLSFMLWVRLRLI